MKLRSSGLVWIVAGILLGLLASHVRNALRSGPFRDEFGSVAFPAPWYLQTVSICALVAVALGLILTIRDLVRWIWKRHEHTS